MELKEAIKVQEERLESLNSHIKNYEESDCKTSNYQNLCTERDSTICILQYLKDSIDKEKQIETIMNSLEDEISLYKYQRELQYDVPTEISYDECLEKEAQLDLLNKIFKNQ